MAKAAPTAAKTRRTTAEGAAAAAVVTSRTTLPLSGSVGRKLSATPGVLEARERNADIWEEDTGTLSCTRRTAVSRPPSKYCTYIVYCKSIRTLNTVQTTISLHPGVVREPL